MTVDLNSVVAQSADAAGMHAPVPTLVLELQALLGTLSANVAASTNRGRQPFRPTPDWTGRLGELGYGMYLLADATGVDLATAVTETAQRVADSARPKAGSAFFDA